MGSIGTIGKIIVALALVAGAVTALEVAARPAARKELVCPDDVGVAGPDEVERTYGGEYPRYQFRAVWSDGRVYEFWSYNPGRDSSRSGLEPYYRCYWPGRCREGAGWHGFRTLQNGTRDEIQYCSRHMRVAMGFSRE